jgi:hypothetical protein
MGTPVAVTFANIFLYYIEMPILREIKIKYGIELYYRRYIDDIFTFAPLPVANFFLNAFQSQFETIKLEAITLSTTGVHQDLSFTLIPCPDNLSLNVKHTLFQKPTNCYQYIPFLSAHRPHVFNNFILQELKRYLLYCSDYIDFQTLSSQFAQRLLARGYPIHCYATVLSQLPSKTALMRTLLMKRKHNDNTPKLFAVLELPTLKPQPSWSTIFSASPLLTSIKKFNKIYNGKNIQISYKSAKNAAYFLTHSQLPQLTR